MNIVRIDKFWNAIQTEDSSEDYIQYPTLFLFKKNFFCKILKNLIS